MSAHAYFPARASGATCTGVESEEVIWRGQGSKVRGHLTDHWSIGHKSYFFHMSGESVTRNGGLSCTEHTVNDSDRFGSIH